MMTEILISVLMPVYNGEKFIELAIESILNQDYRNIELIIVNDGSKDLTRKIVEKYSLKDSRVVLLNLSKNFGIASALDTGVSHCRGKYILRMDADDIALPGRISKQVSFMERNHEIVVSGGSMEQIDSNGQNIGQIRSCKPGQLLGQSPILQPTAIIRSDVLKYNKITYVNNYCHPVEDYHLWLQLSKYGRLGSVDDVLVKYRIHKDSAKAMNARRLLLGTIKTKYFAVTRLKIRPRPVDFVLALLQIFLLILPSKWIYKLYLIREFGLGVVARGRV